MKSGDRVKLNKDMDDLKAGSLGTVVVAKEDFPFTKEPTAVLAVHFDGDKYPSISRSIGTEREYVKNNCSLLC